MLQCLKKIFSPNIEKINQKNKKDQILGGLFGLCIGDAIGVPFEDEKREYLKRHLIKDMEEFRTHYQPKGTWSDDSSQTFLTVKNLCTNLNLEDIALSFVEWYEKGSWTATGKVFDIGKTTEKAICNIKNGIKPELCGDDSINSNGNGSLMRILPLAYYLENYVNVEDKFKIIHDISSITHRHIRSKIACSIYVEFAINLLKDMAPREAYIEMKKTILNYYQNRVDTNELHCFDRILSADISQLKEKDIKSSGYVIDTLEACLWCFLNSISYKMTVLKAVNLGGDCDTVGALSGGLSGIYYGFSNIPAEWLNKIARKNDILDLCNEFYMSLNH